MNLMILESKIAFMFWMENIILILLNLQSSNNSEMVYRVSSLIMINLLTFHFKHHSITLASKIEIRQYFFVQLSLDYWESLSRNLMH